MSAESPTSVMIVDDTPENLRVLSRALTDRGYRVMAFPSGALALRALESSVPDIALLDVNMPGMNGYELCEAIRSLQLDRRVPILFISAMQDTDAKLKAFDAGGLDYITKPFNPRELTIRARNLLTRVNSAVAESEEKGSVEYYRFNGWSLEINSRSLVNPQGESYKLPRSEFRAMLHFVENPGKILTREQLILEMTGRELRPNDRTVDVTIRRIRKHFESETNADDLIVTIHGEGYRFCGSVDH